jgi:hypothetical protein
VVLGRQVADPNLRRMEEHQGSERLRGFQDREQWVVVPVEPVDMGMDASADEPVAHGALEFSHRRRRILKRQMRTALEPVGPARCDFGEVVVDGLCAFGAARYWARDGLIDST